MLNSNCKTCLHQSVCPKINISDCKNFKNENLFKLIPCKVGDLLYVLVEMNEDGKYTRVKVDKVQGIYLNEDNEWMLEFTYIWHDTELSDIGVTVFLVKEEADLALQNQL